MTWTAGLKVLFWKTLSVLFGGFHFFSYGKV